ncbi:MAG: signal peptidase I [Thermoanaerobaculia bacterium]|nr:signal peptidase I [Thermoanaerobaculia bacterium]
MESKRSELRQYLEALLIAAIFLGFSNTFVVKTFYIPSGSMRETLEIGDHLFVNRFVFGPATTKLEHWLTPARDVRRGDVVIFRSIEEPKNDLVKRCIGLPGDEILIIDKQLFINRQKVDDASYAIHRDAQIKPRPPTHGNRPGSYAFSVRDNFGPVVVPADHYFFLGDNRDESYDSRFWGFVPRHFIKGRAFVIYWSYGGQVSDGTWRGWGNKAAEVARTAVGFFTNTRWERTFHLVR